MTVGVMRVLHCGASTAHAGERDSAFGVRVGGGQ